MMKVYEISSNVHYYGIALVAANSAEEANEYIMKFKEDDPNNILDSFGYSFVDEDDCLEDLSSNKAGIVYYGISYSG